MLPTFTLVQQQGGYGLYRATQPATPGALLLYFLLVPPGPGTDAPLSLQDSWGYAGGYLFSAAPITTDPQTLAGTLGLSQAPANQRALLWLTATASQLPLNPSTPGALTGQVAGGGASIPLLDVQVTVASATSFTLSLDPPQLSVAASGVQMARIGGGGVGTLAPGGNLVVSLDPTDPGRLAFPATWDAFFFYQLLSDDPSGNSYPHGGEVRYFYPGKNGDAQLVYPVFAPVPQPGQLFLSLNALLDPLNPADGTRTSFLFAGEAPGGVSLACASTVAGAPVTLTPRDGAGFWLGLRPASPPATGVAGYLAPLGPFALSLPSGPARLMCGTSGVEFLGAAGGDTLLFTPGHPAYAPAFGNGGGTPGTTLNSTYSTAWVTVQPGSTPAPRGYFAQPAAAVSYAPAALAAMAVPGAVTSFVSDSGIPLPLGTYGGVFLNNPDGTPGPNAGIPTTLFAAFEQQVLAPSRHALAPASATTGPLFADQTGAALHGLAATPQGLLVQLNDGSTPFTPPSGGSAVPAGPAGTFQQLLLARSGNAYLSFDPVASGTVDGRLGNVLMRNQLFLVLNAWDDFGDAMESELGVAGFNFQVAPDRDMTPTQRASTILVFKFATGISLASLIADASTWAEPDVFVTDVAQAQATLQAALAAAGVVGGEPTPGPAPGDDDNAFGYFRDEIAVDPAWTGVLAFNAPINANGMPLDLQMLFAGINGQLYAHHFGVEVNQLAIGAGSAPTGIAQSSLFGVIHYPSTNQVPTVAAAPATPPAYDFEVEKLVVAIRNSAVTVFDCKVGMTIQALFGRQVSIQPPSTPANTVTIPGRYQKHGSVGTVTFSAAESAAFLFSLGGAYVRVLDRFAVTGATLVPVGRVDNGDGTATITSRFTLAGALAFNAQPFPGVTGLDLFTYGVVSADSVAGVNVAGLALDISFLLDADGKKQGAAQIVPDFSALQLTDNPAGQRPGGLLTAMPLTLDSFIQSASGISASSLGGAPVNVAGLITAGDQETVRPVNYVTSAPQFAMRFALPMGSLGNLAEAGASLDSFLVLAWGPSTASPDDDGAALYVQLPEASAGAMGFNLQGLIKTTFGDANLARVDLGNGTSPYVLLFNNVALSVLGITFPPRVIVDFILFSDPASPGTGSMGWSLAATQPG